MFKGIMAGIIAGIFWGTPFLAPMILSDYTPFEISFGRFCFFAVIGLLFLPRVWRLCRSLSATDLLKIFALSATGYWLYTLILFYGVQKTGGIFAALIIGCLPITITLFGNPTVNKKLWIGLSCILIGLGALVLPPILANDHSLHFIGLFAVFCALCLWTQFGVHNSYFMAKHREIHALDYTCLMGLISIVFILPSFAAVHGFHSLSLHPDLTRYIIWCAVLGLGASFIANVFWTYSAKNCPPAIGGSLIVSETIFGLLYSFLFEHRLPHVNEWIAIIALICGVIVSIRSQMNKHSTVSSEKIAS